MNTQLKAVRKLRGLSQWQRSWDMQKWIVFTMLIFLLCGCDAGIQQGWITAKHYDPGYTYYSSGGYTTVCTDYEEDRECHSVYHSGHYIDNPPSYELDINSCKHNTNSDKCSSNTIEVDQHDYDSYSVGQYYGTQT